MKVAVLIHLNKSQHERIHKLADKIGRPAKQLIEGYLTEYPMLTEQEKRETAKALKLKKTDNQQQQETI